MNKKAFTLVEIIIVVFVLLFLIAIPLVSFWTERSLDFWASYSHGHPVTTSYWISFVVTIFLPFALLGNVVTEILRIILT